MKTRKRETLIKGTTTGQCSVCLSLCYEILWTILNMGKGRTREDDPRNKEIDDDDQGFTNEREYKQTRKN